jgi:hypothetical protein
MQAQADELHNTLGVASTAYKQGKHWLAITGAPLKG